MAKRNWTPEQKLAIQTVGKTLLVSAAAGSGKTAVLTERIIRRLTDEKCPIDITDMLVVTFTNAAVGELRERISSAVEEKVKENPKNERLRRQLLLLPGAKICTIDAFCGDILRANCDAVGVSPAYRIADKAEAELLAENILDTLIDGVYRGEDRVVPSEDFDRLAECLTDTKEQGTISSVIRYLYALTRRSVEGIGSLKRLAELYNPDNLRDGVNSTPYAIYITDRAHEMAEHYISVLEKTRYEVSGFVGADKIIDTLSSDLAFLRKILSCEGYTALYEVFSAFCFATSPNKLKDPAAPNTTDLRKELKIALEDFKSGYMYYTEQTWKIAYEEIYKVLSTLVKLVYEFDRRFVGEKVRRGALEYSDVTRFTYECLVKDGAHTPLAFAEKDKYEAIFIDEYQDVDSLQDAIFDAISRDNNRFMVGDIKQSIYGFRGAEPTLFAKKKNAFAPLTPSDSIDTNEPRTIFMSDNFRCDRGVIDFVNKIFDTVFELDKESVGYTEFDRLNFSKVYDGTAPSEVINPEICVIDRNYLPLGEDTPGELNQPILVAKKIKKLIETERLNSGEPIRPKDIAIILRSAKDRAENYASALSLYGIPSSCDDDKDFFLNREVLLSLCLLNAIDNPEREIYLAGLMLSPLYNFTADDMVKIKKTGEDGLYSCLKKYTEDNPDFEKGERFLSSLARYRAIAEGMSVDKLLFRLYAETGLLSLASKNGGKENLLLLYNYAENFEASSFKGLYNFIGYINGLIERGGTFEKKKGAANEDAVSIITVHSSKGLEYPVVFFAAAECETVKKENEKKRFLYKDGFGIGIYFRTPSGLALVRNPMRQAIKNRIERDEFKEAERILYVALTRARERLYITAKSRGLAQGLIEKALARREFPSRYSLYSCSSFIDLILYAAPHSSLLDVGEFLGDNGDNIEENTVNGGICVEKSEQIPYTDGELETTLKSRFGFKYKDLYFTDLPEKMSVSNLYPTVLDGTDENTVRLFEEEENVNKSRRTVAPVFITGEDADLSIKRGIATHKMLQFCDFSELERTGVDAEIERLIKDGFITHGDLDLIRREEIELFRKSRLLSEILGAKRLWRELRFNLRLPAENFTADEERKSAYKDRGETVLVQGVIDCLIEDEKGNLHLIDYKTDRLTKEELSDKALATKKLSLLHSTQLSYYADAVNTVFGREVASVRVYSLPLGDTVEVG